jgi:hypothetical protein
LHTNGGTWVVRYASVDTEDKYGGSVVLASPVSIHNLHEGDLVTLRGEIISDGRTIRNLGGALYRAYSIEKVGQGN